MTTLPLATNPEEPDSVLAVDAEGRILAENAAKHPNIGAPVHYDAVHVLCNPKAGHSESESILNTMVKPLFEKLQILTEVYMTRHAGDATTLGQRLRSEDESVSGTKRTLIVILGGDGTTHELLQGLDVESGRPLTATYHFAIIPLGTANAVYHHLFPFASSKYTSLKAALQSHAHAPLPLISVHLNESRHIAHVVASTALHASILYDSETLRESVPGLERFQQAARMNWTNTYPGRMQLLGDQVQRYSPQSKSFETRHQKATEAETRDWVYLNAVLTDRLEATFIVAPLRKPAAASDFMDIVAIQKPERTSTEQFSAALSDIVKAMYDGGKHVDLVWTETGTVKVWQEGDSEEDLVVEYWRCKELTWTPTREENYKSHLICIDGALHTLQDGNKAQFRTLNVESLRLCV